ncbi:hypothetical protein WA026_000993 [Henosepilachna vigintioctopunctata]|uniref:Uncharacterized protein n=1 Tax=Henosepilachna vigintioctopunctata TaxID=420089 RepID=A0AAW1V971_9CUCU
MAKIVVWFFVRYSPETKWTNMATPSWATLTECICIDRKKVQGSETITRKYPGNFAIFPYTNYSHIHLGSPKRVKVRVLQLTVDGPGNDGVVSIAPPHAESELSWRPRQCCWGPHFGGVTLTAARCFGGGGVSSRIGRS